MSAQYQKPDYIRLSNSSSFFDDDTPHSKFEFVVIGENHHQIPSQLQKIPLCYENFQLKNLLSKHDCKGCFALYDGFIANTIRVDSDFQVLSYLYIDTAVLSPKITNPNETYSFTITKNCVSYEFTTSNEASIDDWLAAMKLICIHYNFHDEFRAIKMIGKGSFARVYLAENIQTKLQYAVKACSKEYLMHSTKNHAKASVINEIKILCQLHHEHIMELHQVFETENSLYMVTELVKGKTLEYILSKSTKYNEVRFKNMIRKILEVLEYLSSKKIMHRDLKPDNILVDENDNIKIVDFGLAAYINSKELIFDKCGTPGYIAPEVFRYDASKPNTNYDEKCDVFSAGCIFYYMYHLFIEFILAKSLLFLFNRLFGIKFFPGKKSSEILSANKDYKNNIYGPYQALLTQYNNQSSAIPRDALHLLLQMLEGDPNKRISASKALQSPYLETKLNSIVNKKSLSDTDIKLVHAFNVKSVFATKNNNVEDENCKIQEPDYNLKPSNESDVSNGLTAHHPKKFENNKNRVSLFLNIDPPLMNGAINTWDSNNNNPDSKNSTNFSVPINKQVSAAKFLSHFAETPKNDIKIETPMINIEGTHGSHHRRRSSDNNVCMKLALFKNLEKPELALSDMINGNNGSNNSNLALPLTPNLGFKEYLESNSNKFVVVEEESELVQTPSPIAPFTQKKLQQLQTVYVPSKK